MSRRHTIAMARDLLVEGRATAVEQMLTPLVKEAASQDPADAVLRALLARIRILYYNDASGAQALLAAYTDRAARAALDPATRAEVLLWLGWTHAWQHPVAYDPALALALLNRAYLLYCDAADAHGQCWTRIGQAVAYLSIDEFELMQRALHDAQALQNRVSDAQATLWICDLSATRARYLGLLDEAHQHVTAFHDLAHIHHDNLACGRARAHLATLAFETGASPDIILNNAGRTLALYRQAASESGIAQLSARRIRIQALIRKGDWATAEHELRQARSAAGAWTTARTSLQVQQLRLNTLRGRFEAAEQSAVTLLASVATAYNRMLAADAFLAVAEFNQAVHRFEPALDFAHRALRAAQCADHLGYLQQARLLLADLHLDLNDVNSAHALLLEADDHLESFTRLPLAAFRFQIRARLAEHARPTDALADWMLAHLAYSMVGDRLRSARCELDQAKCILDAAPAQASGLIEGALRTFEILGAAGDTERARALADQLPAAGASPSFPQPSPEQLLLRATVSLELVAETGLQQVVEGATVRWCALYRAEGRSPESLFMLRCRGVAPASLALSSLLPALEPTRVNDAVVLRLPGDTNQPFLFAFEPEPGNATEAVTERVARRLPTLALALELAASRAALASSSAGEASANQAGAHEGSHPSADVRRVIRELFPVRRSQLPVLVHGENGTCVDDLARAIVSNGLRNDQPFHVLDFLHPDRISFEQRLFGRLDAEQDDGLIPGLMHRADGGTVLLKHIAACPQSLQRQLIQVLDEGLFFPVGSPDPTPVDVRLIASLQASQPEEANADPVFDALLTQLSYISVQLRPLRERREEIPALVRHLLHTLAPSLHVSVTKPALHALLQYDFPGNDRQLKNELEQALAKVRSEAAPTIDLPHLSPALRLHLLSPASATASSGQWLAEGHNLDDLLAATERDLIVQALHANEGNVRAAADALGLTRQGLYKKIKRLGIDLTTPALKEA